MGTVRLLLIAIAGLSLFGCPSSDDGDDAPADVGSTDRGTVDGGDAGRDGGVDGGNSDGGGMDAGPGDGGFADAGGGGAFVERVMDETGVHGQGVEAIDLEGDGDLDVIVAFSFSDTVRIYLNDGNANFTTARPAAENSIVAMHAIAEDFDGDGDRDLAAVGLFLRAGGPGEVTWFENPGDPLGNWTRREITGSTINFPIYIQSADLTGDGAADLVIGCTYNDPDGNGVFWFRNTGGAFAGPLPIEAALPNVRTVLVHDVDGDGVVDVLAASTGGNELVWYENERTGVDDNPTFARHTIAAPTAPFGMRLADMDGDAALELVSSGDNGSGGQIAWFDPPADPRDLWTEHPVSAEHGDQATRLAIGDFDGDGLNDVASVTYEDNEVRVYFAEAGGQFTSVQIMGGHTGSNAINAGDLDGDSRIDLITTTYGFDSSFDRISWWDNGP